MILISIFIVLEEEEGGGGGGIENFTSRTPNCIAAAGIDNRICNKIPLNNDLIVTTDWIKEGIVVCGLVCGVGSCVICVGSSIGSVVAVVDNLLFVIICARVLNESRGYKIICERARDNPPAIIDFLNVIIFFVCNFSVSFLLLLQKDEIKFFFFKINSFNSFFYYNFNFFPFFFLFLW